MQIAAVMLTHDPKATLWDSLTALGRQRVPVTLFVCDNESKDGTEWWIRTHRFKNDLGVAGLPEVRVLPSIPCKKSVFPDPRERLNKTVEHAAAKFAWECSRMDPVPDALFWLDPDVIMPGGALRAATDRMNEEPRLGAVGIDYGPPVDHVRMGCTLYRWAAWAELAQIGFFSKGCVCRWICRTLEARGWQVEKLEGFTAEHRKGKPCPTRQP